MTNLSPNLTDKELNPEVNTISPEINILTELYREKLTPWQGQGLTAFDRFALDKMSETLKTGNTILVPGCGDGNFARILLHELNQKGIYVKISACDIIPEAIEQAKEAISSPDITFSAQDILTIDGKFDVVYERCLLHFFITERERTAYARKIFECLKPGAKYFGLTFDTNNENCNQETKLGASLHFPKGLRYSSKEDLESLFGLYFDKQEVFDSQVDIPTVGENFSRNGLGYYYTRSSHGDILHKISSEYSPETPYANAEFEGVNRVDVPREKIPEILMRFGIDQVIIEQIMKNNHFDFVSMSPGSEITPHTHKTQAFALPIHGHGSIAVEQGSGDYDIKNPNFGEVIIFPSGKGHALRADGGEGLLFLAGSESPIVHDDTVVDLELITPNPEVF